MIDLLFDLYQQGRINDVETPMTELYDADTIEIGDAKLRFNRVGDERPHQEADL